MAKKTKEDLKWQAQYDLDTLRRAAEIQADKARMKRAQAEAKNQINAIQKVVNK